MRNFLTKQCDCKTVDNCVSVTRTVLCEQARSPRCCLQKDSVICKFHCTDCCMVCTYELAICRVLKMMFDVCS